jgi:phage-related baseplate assembly protein
LSASPKIEEVGIPIIPNPQGVVKLYLKTDDNSNLTADVLKVLSADKVRPLTDKVEAYQATRTTMSVKATLELVDIDRAREIQDKILATTKRFALGEDVNLSYLYKTLHQDGVYRADITEIWINGVKVAIASKITADSEFVEITEWTLECKEMVW